MAALFNHLMEGLIAWLVLEIENLRGKYVCVYEETRHGQVMKDLYNSASAGQNDFLHKPIDLDYSEPLPLYRRGIC